MTLVGLLKNVRVIPVVTLECVADALPLTEALISGGISCIEITLRTKAALPAIEAIAKTFSEVTIGAGTIIDPEQFKSIQSAGAQFAVSPGLTERLHQAAQQSEIPYLPGVSTVSEAMQAREWGYSVLKFFPAEYLGGVKLLSTWHAVLPELLFCPTGSIQPTQLNAYLSLKSVVSVGGTWMTPDTLIQKKEWIGIRALAQEALHASRLTLPGEGLAKNGVSDYDEQRRLGS